MRLNDEKRKLPVSKSILVFYQLNGSDSIYIYVGPYKEQGHCSQLAAILHHNISMEVQKEGERDIEACVRRQT